MDSREEGIETFYEWLSLQGYEIQDENDLLETFNEYEVEEMFGKYNDQLT